jgi:hypothetical protein
MRVNRGLLYPGVFLVAIGAVVVLADRGGIDTPTLADVVRLWPLAVIAVGLGLALRRSRVGIAGGLAAAVMPGLLVGSAVSVVPRVAGDCGVREQAVPVLHESDAATPEVVWLRTSCGTLSVRTAPGAGWSLDVASTAATAPTVSTAGGFLREAGDILEIASDHDEGEWRLLGSGREEWMVTLPTASTMDGLSFNLNSTRADVALPGARIGQMTLIANASYARVDASATQLASLEASFNMSSGSLHLPDVDELSVSVAVRAGDVEICTPPGLALSVSSSGYSRSVLIEGIDRSGEHWLSPDYESAARHADLDIRATFGTVAINPIGGCR